MADVHGYDEYNYEDYVYYEYNYTDYSYEDNLGFLPLNELVPSVTFYSLIGLLGIAGNLLVIVAILTFPRMKTITNVFLFSLASADLLLVLICIPIKCAMFFSYTWRMGAFLCVFTHYIQNVSKVCSVATLTVMSIERFIAILYPLQARSLCSKRHAKIVTILIWVLSFVLCSPTAIVVQLKEIVGKNRTAYWCMKEFHTKTYHIMYEIYMFVILFCIPLVIMLMTYIRISIEIWDVVSKRAVLRSGSEYQYCATNAGMTGIVRPDSRIPAWSSAKNPPTAYTDDTKTRKQVILMLMVIVVLYAICWCPILVNNLLIAFERLPPISIGYLKPMRLAFNLMSYSNSCVNPIVYAIMSKNFQESLRSVMKCKQNNSNPRGYVYSTDTTRGSILKSSNYSEEKENGAIEMN